VRGLPPLRYGVELEGPHKGLRTLVLLSVAYHTTGALRQALAAKPGRPVDVQHVWLERQPWERYSWVHVRQLVAALDVPMTLLAMDDADVPPPSLRRRLSLVWRVPDDCVSVARICGHLQVLDGAPFEGAEVTVQGVRPFDAAAYGKDETWTL
jgi:hypothetical protein